MVTQYGMTERVGAIQLGQSGGEVFLGRDMGHQRDYSEDVAAVVDDRGAPVDRGRARRGLAGPGGQPQVLDDLVLALFEKETLNKEELAQIFSVVVKRPERPVWLSSDQRAVSSIPPVLTPGERAAANGHGEHPAGLPTGDLR